MLKQFSVATMIGKMAALVLRNPGRDILQNANTNVGFPLNQRLPFKVIFFIFPFSQSLSMRVGTTTTPFRRLQKSYSASYRRRHSATCLWRCNRLNDV